jgi:hypothetical protein
VKPYAFEELSKEELVKLLGTYLRALTAVDGWWFTGVEQALGMEKALEIDRFVWERAGKAEGQRMKLALNLGEDAAAIASAFALASCPGPTSQLEVQQVSPTRVVYRVTACPPQQGRLKMGKGVFDCSGVCQAHFQSFAQAISPGVRVTRAFSPPEKYSPDLWCEWYFDLE